MSVEPAGEVPVEPGDSPPHLSRWITGAALAVLLALAAVVFWPSHTLDTLDRPEESLERVVTRDMDFRAAARAAPAWERRLHVLAFSSDASARADAIAWYEELIQAEVSPLPELYRIVLLAEDGQTDAVRAALAAWAPGADDWARRLAGWAGAAYGPEAPPADELRAALGAVRQGLPPGWFADRLAARLASRLGDAAAEAESERAIDKRGTRMLWRLRGILVGETLLVALGLLALVVWLRNPRARVARVASAPIPPRWTGWDGIGLFARGALGLVGVAVAWQLLPDRGWSILLVSALQTVPLGYYLVWYCRRSGTTVGETFGLRVPAPARATLAWATLGLIGVSTLADVLTDTAGTWLGVETHWTDGFQERLVWGRAGEVAADIADSCVFAPVLEELLFRGVLYGTLRLRLAPLPAALASAAIFALAHGYGVVGFASVLGSGVLWAIAYERTRSLLPGMLAHAASNVQATAIVLATLRF
jgi:membrane protease YdiL (CAAX protease family)